MPLTKQDIVQGLRELGVRPGMVLMVHSSLSAFGEVEGGAKTVIEALLEAIGPEGTLAMPTMSADAVFDVDNSPSVLGVITETFRKWPGVVRSLHPTHSVAALGPRAQELVEGHINEPSAIGPGSPWGKLACWDNGYVLLLGVDQDRNTLLHYPEDLADMPYLRTVTRQYKDPDTGEVRMKQLVRFPGPHRDFIGLDRLLLEGGAMRVGRIGQAVCRLMHAGRTVQLVLEALRRDPAAVLCTNPRCVDCLEQRAAIRRHQLAQEAFTLTAVADDISPEPGRLAEALRIFRWCAVEAVELGPEMASALVEAGEEAQIRAAQVLEDAGFRVQSVAWKLPSEQWVPGEEAMLKPLLVLAERLGAKWVVIEPVGEARDWAAWVEAAREMLEGLQPAAKAAEVEVLVENVPGTPLSTKRQCEEFFEPLPLEVAKLAFNPAHFAQAGEKPFLGVYYKGPLKKRVRQLYIQDGCAPGAPLYQRYTLPGEGQGEVKELISILRCRSFQGAMCLKVGWGEGEEAFRKHAAAFFHLLDTM